MSEQPTSQSSHNDSRSSSTVLENENVLEFRHENLEERTLTVESVSTDISNLHHVRLSRMHEEDARQYETLNKAA